MTAEEIVERLKEVCKTKWIRWDVSVCDVCGGPIGYIFDGGDAFFDEGCGCTPIHDNPQPREWNDIIDFVSQNMGTSIVQDLINYITEE